MTDTTESRASKVQVSLFNSHRAHGFPEWHIVGLRFGYPYDQRGYKLATINAGPEARFNAPKSLADLCVETGMVRSRSEVKRLIAHGGLTCAVFPGGLPLPTGKGWWEALPERWAIYHVRKGSQFLEIVMETPGDWMLDAGDVEAHVKGRMPDGFAFVRMEGRFKAVLKSTVEAAVQDKGRALMALERTLRDEVDCRMEVFLEPKGDINALRRRLRGVTAGWERRDQ